MVNEAQICLAGYVATQPVARRVKDGVMNLSMRVAWTPRWQDRVSGEWVDGGTSYATVICWRKLADNAALCLRKGDPVVVKGRLTVRSYDKEGVTRSAVEVEASAIGHDLSHGVAKFLRVRPQTGTTAAEFAAFEGSGGQQAADSPNGTPGEPAGGTVPGQDGSAPDEIGESFFDESALGNSPADEGAEASGHRDGAAGTGGRDGAADAAADAAAERSAVPF